MRAAPAADAALSGARVARVLVVLLHLASAASLLAWAAAWRPAGFAVVPDGAVAVIVLCALLTATGLARWQARRLFDHRPQRLVWDGAVWRLRHPDGTCLLAGVCLQIDLGPTVLLRLQAATPAGAMAAAARPRSCWVLATARAAGADWHGLRVALHHHAGVAPVPPAGAAGLVA